MTNNWTPNNSTWPEQGLLRPSGDNDRDRRRIKNAYGILIPTHGKGHFQFQVLENGKGHLINFPNDATCIGLDMFDRLKS
jgi:hypothetical protein